MTPRTTITLLACLVALAGCGGGETDESQKIPAETRAELDKQLESIENRFDAGGGACSDIAENQQIVAREIDGLGGDVDPEIRDALTRGFDRLFELTGSQCDEEKGQETETTPTETTPEPAPTETTPPDTTETTPPEQTETQPNDGDGDSGGGNGDDGGGGNGGGALVPDGDGDGGAGVP